jgi:hypothetical protein
MYRKSAYLDPTANLVCERPPTKIIINMAKSEDASRTFEALGGIAPAQSAELKAGLAALNAQKKN